MKEFDCNSVTKPVVFLLPWIDELLDKSGQAKYFTTLDLKSGYWQIKVDTFRSTHKAHIESIGMF